MARCIIMRGTSYSGKSTLIREVFLGYDGWTEDCVVCPDAIRLMLTGDMECQTQNKSVFEIAKLVAHTRFKMDRDVIWDATNTRLKYVKGVADIAHRYKIRVMMIDLGVPSVEVLEERIAHRANLERPPIPEDVLARQRKDYEAGTPMILAWAKKINEETEGLFGWMRVNSVDHSGEKVL